MLTKLIDKIKTYQYQLFLSLCVCLVAFIGYNLGKINSIDKQPLKITTGANIYSAIKTDTQKELSSSDTPKPVPKILDTRVVVSKNSDKYHYTWCSGAKKIKPENQIWFDSDKEAESKGFTLAGNCTK